MNIFENTAQSIKPIQKSYNQGGINRRNLTEQWQLFFEHVRNQQKCAQLKTNKIDNSKNREHAS